MTEREAPVTHRRYETPVLTRKEQIREIISLIPAVSYEVLLWIKDGAIELARWLLLGVIMVWVPIAIITLMAIWLGGGR